VLWSLGGYAKSLGKRYVRRNRNKTTFMTAASFLSWGRAYPEHGRSKSANNAEAYARQEVLLLDCGDEGTLNGNERHHNNQPPPPPTPSIAHMGQKHGVTALVTGGEV